VRPAANEARFTIGAAVVLWVAAYVAALPLQSLVVVVMGQSGNDPDTWPTSATAASVLCLWIPFLVGLVLLSRAKGGASFRDDFRIRFRPVDLIGVPVGLASQLVLIPLLYWPLSEWFPGTFGPDQVEERATELWDRASGGWVLVLVAVVAIGAPIVEELVYRGAIQQSLEGRLNDGVALVASAAFFALIHLQPVELPGLFVAGLAFGLCWQRSGRIACPILAHMAFNAAGLVLAAR
jgi:membrane protease YdiL (CAAX protease family)